METGQNDSAKSTLWLHYVAPSEPALMLALGGWLGETLLLGRDRNHIYQMSGVMPVLAVLSLAWFWITAGWLITHGVQFVQRSKRMRSVRASITRMLIATTGFVAVVFYVASWGFYLRTGRFIGLQVVIRVVEDGPELWQYLLTAEPFHLVAFVVIALLALTVTLLLIVCIVRYGSEVASSSELIRKRRTIWCVFTILVGIVFRFVAADPSDLRREPRIATLKLRLNPVFTLVGTTIDALVDEHIDPCLDTATLEPRSTRWQIVESHTKEQPPIIFVVIEAMRHDVVNLVHNGHEVTPNLNALARAGLQMTHAYSQSTHTDYAEPSIVSSLYPARTRRHHYYQPSDPWPKTLIYDLLKPAGYSTALVSSENLGWGAMDKFFQSPSLDFTYEAQHSDEPTSVPDQDGGFVFETTTGPLRAGKLDDAVTATQAINWIAHQTARHRPFFLYIDFQSSHFPYPIGSDAARPFQPCEFSSRVTFMDYPIEETEIVRNAYYNALHEADHQLGRLVAALSDHRVLDRAILMVTGDHGEAFHEHDRVTHAREPYEPLVRVPLIIHSPAHVPAGVDDYPVQHIDMVPTALALIGHPQHPNLQGVNVLASDRLPPEYRLLFMHAENGLARADAILLGGRWKLINDRRNKQHVLYDLSTDPNELTDLAERNEAMTVALQSLLDSWRNRQLAYYHYSRFHLGFYPPSTPSAIVMPWSTAVTANVTHDSSPRN